MQFYLDEDISQRVAAIARALGVDVTSAQELGRYGHSDEAQLRFATAAARILVTRNYDDFSFLAKRSVQEAKPHPGILFVPRSLLGGDYAAIARALARYERDHPAGIPPYMTDYLMSA